MDHTEGSGKEATLGALAGPGGAHHHHAGPCGKQTLAKGGEEVAGGGDLSTSHDEITRDMDDFKTFQFRSWLAEKAEKVHLLCGEKTAVIINQRDHNWHFAFFVFSVLIFWCRGRFFCLLK